MLENNQIDLVLIISQSQDIKHLSVNYFDIEAHFSAHIDSTFYVSQLPLFNDVPIVTQ